MPLPLPTLKTLAAATSNDAWQRILATAWETCAPTISPATPSADVTRRDRDLADLDLFLAAAGWDLWNTFEESVEQTSDALASWWEGPGGRAVLILDGLSLREVPWITAGAKARGYSVLTARPTGSELPGETNAFARALGYQQRSSLTNNASAGRSTRLPGARTECVDLPWEDCANIITPDQRWVFWHCWPDASLHDMAVAGRGLDPLVNEAAARLGSESFWGFVHRLTTGRRLLITSDHGYAASGLFPDASDDQARYLRERFGSSRFTTDTHPTGPWVPPLDLTITSRHGKHDYALGRRKWRSPAGYPTLAHGGLTVLEVTSPFIELSRGE